MENDGTDEAIFSVLSEIPKHWRKVAFVVGRVAGTMGDGSNHEDAAHESVARRIEFLVSEGRLLAKGDIKNWRYSEVRLPD